MDIYSSPQALNSETLLVCLRISASPPLDQRVWFSWCRWWTLVPTVAVSLTVEPERPLNKTLEELQRNHTYSEALGLQIHKT